MAKLTFSSHCQSLFYFYEAVLIINPASGCHKNIYYFSFSLPLVYTAACMLKYKTCETGMLCAKLGTKEFKQTAIRLNLKRAIYSND